MRDGIRMKLIYESEDERLDYQGWASRFRALFRESLKNKRGRRLTYDETKWLEEFFTNIKVDQEPDLVLMARRILGDVER